MSNTKNKTISKVIKQVEKEVEMLNLAVKIREELGKSGKQFYVELISKDIEREEPIINRFANCVGMFIQFVNGKYEIMKLEDVE